MMTVKSTAFDTGQQIPLKYSQEGDNLVPPLVWQGMPEGVKEFAIIVEDPDAPGYRPWVHWLTWGIPGDKTSIAEGESSLYLEGRNSYGRDDYSGPMPPPGHGVHRYRFRIFALDQPLDLYEGATSEDLFDAMEGHILSEAELVGTYRRP